MFKAEELCQISEMYAHSKCELIGCCIKSELSYHRSEEDLLVLAPHINVAQDLSLGHSVILHRTVSKWQEQSLTHGITWHKIAVQ